MSDKKLTFDVIQVHDWAMFIDLMHHHEDYPEELFGKNQDGEMIGVSVNRDNIVVTTWQNNKWIRKDVYHLDGTQEEIYEGRWE